MVRTSPLVRFALCAAAFALCLSALTAQTPLSAGPVLVQARYTKVTDALGFIWDVNSSGGITRGSNCFMSAFSLMIDGDSGSSSSAMMSADGQEYFISGNMNGISFSRRVRVDLKDSYCRFIETLTNGTGEARSFAFAVRARLGGRLQANGLDSGERDVPFDERDAGIIIGGSPAATPPRPAFAWMLASRGAKIRPTVRIEQSTYVTATYPVSLAPGASVTFVHAAAQRTLPANPNAKARAELFVPMTSPRLLADLPVKDRKGFANFTPAAADDDGGAGPGLAALQALLEASGITRDKSDALMVEPGAVITGKITGSDITIGTEFGKSKVPFAEIAAIAGGGGVGRSPRVFLRNGEILSGAVSAEKFSMTAGSGLSLEIDLALIHLLSLAKDAPDGKPPDVAVALLTTQAGDCLALVPEGTSALDAATPWGTFPVPLGEIASFATVRDPVPMQRLALADGSRLPVMLRSGEWQVATARFGTVKIATQSVREIRSVLTKATTPAGAGGEPAPGFPKYELSGENRLAGVIDLPKFHLASAKSTTAIDPKTIATLEREAGEDGVALVKVKLADGQELSGRLVESIVPIRAADRVWRVPAAQIVSVSVPPPAKPKEAAPASPAPAPADRKPPPPPPPETGNIINAPPDRPPLPAPKSSSVKATLHMQVQAKP